ncbi:membrane protein [Corynebacterium tapiri]
MWQRAISVALAFTGVIVGAGFASGQEALQFYVAFGVWGVAGALLASALMLISGVAVLQLGSYYQAREHMSVLSRISNKAIAWILDISTIITLFSIGFVMFAGGGSNLQQQFGLPLWAGAGLMLVLVLITGMMDVNKVSAVIGAITPFVIATILFVTIYTLVTSDWNFAHLNEYSQAEVATTLPNWWISALNYIGLCIMTGVSMAIVIGGNMMDTKAAGFGGLLGGLFFTIMLVLLVAAMFVKVETVNGDAMPVLSLMTDIHPWLGAFMAIVVYGMIFNTAIGMFYALGKRLTRKNPSRYRVVFIVTCLVGFVLSFVGFKTLVAYVYPALGYLGAFRRPPPRPRTRPHRTQNGPAHALLQAQRTRTGQAHRRLQPRRQRLHRIHHRRSPRQTRSRRRTPRLRPHRGTRGRHLRGPHRTRGPG